MAGRGKRDLRQFYHHPPPPPQAEGTRTRDAYIDEIPPEETEKMGYVWVVKGTLDEREEKQEEILSLSLPSSSSSSDQFSESYYPMAHGSVVDLITPKSKMPAADRAAILEKHRYHPHHHHHHHTHQPERRDTRASLQLPCIPSFIREMHEFLNAATDLDEETIQFLKELELERTPENAKDLLTDSVPKATDTRRSSHHHSSKEKKKKNREEKMKEHNKGSKDSFWTKESHGPRNSQEYPFLKNYILNKVCELEDKLKTVTALVNESVVRQEELRTQVFEGEIRKLFLKIATDDEPLEEDVEKLEHLTEQLKISKGIKKEENE